MGYTIGDWIPLQECQRLPSVAGIYAIRNTVNGKEYVGQSIDIRRRFRQHLNMKHESSYLYRAMKVQGLSYFVCCVLLLAEESVLSSLEMLAIKERNCLAPKGYNCTAGGEGTIGYRHSAETKKKLSTISRDSLLSTTPEELERRHRRIKAKWEEPGYKNKMSEVFRRRPKRSEKQRAHQSTISLKRLELDPGYMVRVGEAALAWRTPENLKARSDRYSGGGNPRAKELVMYTKDSLYAIYFPCAEDAAKHLGVSGETARRWGNKGSTHRCPNTAFAYM